MSEGLFVRCRYLPENAIFETKPGLSFKYSRYARFGLPQYNDLSYLLKTFYYFSYQFLGG